MDGWGKRSKTGVLILVPIIIVYHVDVSPPFLAGSTTDLSLTISPSPHSAEQSDQSDQGDQRQFIGSSLIVTCNGISTRNRK